MDLSPFSLFLNIVAGAVGTAYFVYGKKRARYFPMIAAIALCIVPFLFDSHSAQLLLSIVLAAVPWIWRE